MTLSLFGLVTKRAAGSGSPDNGQGSERRKDNKISRERLTRSLRTVLVATSDSEDQENVRRAGDVHV